MYDEDVQYDPLQINDFTIMEFTCGYCSELALAIHEKTGWRLRAETYKDADGDTMLHHAWAVNPQGRAVDIRGLHRGAYAETNPACEPTVIRDYTESEMRGFGVNSECLKWARDLVRLHPKHFGLTPKLVSPKL